MTQKHALHLPTGTAARCGLSLWTATALFHTTVSVTVGVKGHVNTVKLTAGELCQHKLLLLEEAS